MVICSVLNSGFNLAILIGLLINVGMFILGYIQLKQAIKKKTKDELDSKVDEKDFTEYKNQHDKIHDLENEKLSVMDQRLFEMWKHFGLNKK